MELRRIIMAMMTERTAFPNFIMSTVHYST